MMIDAGLWSLRLTFFYECLVRPWFVLNGVHDDNTQNDFQNNPLKWVCGQIQGTKPAGCAQNDAPAKVKVSCQ